MNSIYSGHVFEANLCQLTSLLFLNFQRFARDVWVSNLGHVLRLELIDILRQNLDGNFEIPEFPRLRGEKAIEALSDFINELEEQRGTRLTKKQTNSLIKLAKGLVSSIEAEECARAWLDTFEKEIKELLFMSQLRKKLRNKFWKDCAIFSKTSIT